jgi:Anaphase-promoting complex, cyclosome, subunit 3
MRCQAAIRLISTYWHRSAHSFDEHDLMYALSAILLFTEMSWLQTMYVNKQYRRAFDLLNTQDLNGHNLRFRYLAALCNAESGEWEDCLDIIGAEGMPETMHAKVSSRDAQTFVCCGSLCGRRLTLM